MKYSSQVPKTPLPTPPRAESFFHTCSPLPTYDFPRLSPASRSRWQLVGISFFFFLCPQTNKEPCSIDASARFVVKHMPLFFPPSFPLPHPLQLFPPPSRVPSAIVTETCGPTTVIRLFTSPLQCASFPFLPPLLWPPDLRSNELPLGLKLLETSNAPL